STCHRTEIYTELTDVDAAKQHAMAWLADERGIPRRVFSQHVYHRFDREAVDHLFRVSAGLDSMVVGEAQILGQVREAFKTAAQARTVRARLDTTFRWALKVGKRARTETRINRYSSSIGSVAADLARAALGTLAGKMILVVGAGEMAELATKHLVSHGASELVIANRSLKNAEKLSSLPGVRAARLSELAALMVDADIVITSTGAGGYLIGQEMLQGRGQPLVIIDLALPRDVDPAVAELPGVRLFNIDQLDETIAIGRKGQEAEIARVEDIILQELEEWDVWHSSLGALPTVAALNQLADGIRERELRRTFSRLTHLSERDRREVAALAHAISGKLLHNPMQRLKSRGLGSGYLDVVRDLFGLDEQQDGEACEESVS
ncbi:MAG: glutamyl-tRNA reductase, partial [Chloroflexota bacterium]|nr:glutamyl-tRNA reductase [Chloroflexota bacterium]